MQAKLSECAEAFASIKVKTQKIVAAVCIGYIHTTPC